jgi:hypothetical protein
MGIGIQTVNWNSMDIWVWNGRFEDCGRGVYNVMGNWHVWESLFLRSRVADLSTMNLMAFSAVNSTSVGSRRFFDFSTGHTWGSPVSLTGNRVLDPTGDWGSHPRQRRAISRRGQPISPHRPGARRAHDVG